MDRMIMPGALGILLITLASCGMRKIQLENNITDVPKNIKAYKNRIKFDSSVLKYIDTSMAYEEIGYLDKWNNAFVSRNGNYKRVYRFYSNGFMNHYIMDTDELFTPKEYDPGYSGFRGVYYRNGDKIIGELFGPVNGLRHLGKIKEYFKIKGDTMIVSRGRSDKYSYVYMKRKLPPGYIQSAPDWDNK